MMTGLDDDASVQRAYDEGATDFIVKPIIWPILVQRVRYNLRASAACGSGRAGLFSAGADRRHAGADPDGRRQGRSLICNSAFDALFGGQALPEPADPISAAGRSSDTKPKC